MKRSKPKTPARLTPAFLAKVGQALHGPSWRAALAGDLNVSERTVRRWADGTTAIAAGVRFDLIVLCQTRAADLAGLVKTLEERFVG